MERLDDRHGGAVFRLDKSDRHGNLLPARRGQRLFKGMHGMDAIIRAVTARSEVLGQVNMPWTAKYDERLAVVEVVNQGDITAEELRRQTAAAVALALDHHANLMLVDAEQMQCAFSLFELVGLVESYETLKMPPAARIAMVLPRSPASARTLRFHETVARNRAYDVSVFPDRAAAMRWLSQRRSDTLP